jgi:hypothetical protein
MKRFYQKVVRKFVKHLVEKLFIYHFIHKVEHFIK